MATTNDLKNGLVLNLDGQLWSVVEFQHVKPGKGGAFVRTKLKNVLSGKVVDKTFNAGTKVETATVDKRDMQYLYKEGSDFVFMDSRVLRADPRAGRDGRRRWPSTCWRTRTPSSPLHEGTPLYVELPGVGRADDLLHRAGHAGRPVHRRHQARDAGDRRRDRGPAVHHHRREGQGRHPRRQLPRPRHRASWPADAARSKARKRALDVLFESEQRGVDPLDDAGRPGGGGRPAGERVHGRAGRGRGRAPGRGSTSC